MQVGKACDGGGIGPPVPHADTKKTKIPRHDLIKTLEMDENRSNTAVLPPFHDLVHPRSRRLRDD
mgnify:FL=1